MEFSKESKLITSSRRGKRRIGSPSYLGDKALGLTYLCYLNGYHWYL